MKMSSIKFIQNMFYLILLLQYSNSILQGSEATYIDMISKEAAVVTSTSSPILKHLLRTGIWDSDAKVSNSDPEAEIPHKGLQNYSYKVDNDIEINQKVKDLGKNFSSAVIAIRKNDGKEGTLFNNATTDVSKLVYSKLAIAIKARLHEMIAKAFPKYSNKSNSFKVDSDITSESSETDTSDKKSKVTSTSHSNEKVATGRQFVFHPYLPYGKDVAPDEKISIGDVLPVKMVKFFKGMVEEAPWEQMFMKMVRMIVDQFVDKIIEKMFAHKDDDHDEWRSLDGGSAKSVWSLPKNVLTYVIRSRRSSDGGSEKSAWSLPKSALTSDVRSRRSSDSGSAKSAWSLPKNILTTVVRSRRSTEGKAKSERVQDWVDKDSSNANRVSKEDRSKTKEPTQEDSWLDSILDFLFPDDPKATEDSDKDKRKRRDSDQTLQDNHKQVSGIMRSFLARYLKFQTEQLSTESVNAILKDSIRQKMSEIISRDGSKHENSNLSVGESSSVPKNSVADTSVDPKSTDVPLRRKRSTGDDNEKVEEEDRLWQASRRPRPRPSNRKSREDCSLRRACNAGRLLSRLPSVQDITMQLKAYDNEPHWDALLWGMTKKRCSRIFCKRQRSPKGTKHHWDGPEKRLHRKSTPDSRNSRLRHDESDLTTIYPV